MWELLGLAGEESNQEYEKFNLGVLQDTQKFTMQQVTTVGIPLAMMIMLGIPAVALLLGNPSFFRRSDIIPPSHDESQSDQHDYYHQTLEDSHLYQQTPDDYFYDEVDTYHQTYENGDYTQIDDYYYQTPDSYHPTSENGDNPQADDSNDPLSNPHHHEHGPHQQSLESGNSYYYENHPNISDYHLPESDSSNQHSTESQNYYQNSSEIENHQPTESDAYLYYQTPESDGNYYYQLPGSEKSYHHHHHHHHHSGSENPNQQTPESEQFHHQPPESYHYHDRPLETGEYERVGDNIDYQVNHQKQLQEHPQKHPWHTLDNDEG